MSIDTNKKVSISEENKDCSKGARSTDIEDTEIEMTDDEKIDVVAARILKKYHRAFEELAK